ncbi:unnamed protein product [Aphanomyces euteiches]|uniref:ADP-ribosylation factor n=1 Tax=Aphanomyces euteiches TaxID=100861 RepID=A0A6G0XE74_9STRA|nr:hypothetical protein Ae201684_005648 [Aphanomyces euteiches]KAH9078327.1 hypothetical protein Ae201684P_019418 [Aphanomyces euteiches]KAH9142891.1 hypothetical protein AeRB84_013055 [Aphanomyces euteiches]
MGACCGHLFGDKDARVMIVGLDNAGKTTLLYQYLGFPGPSTKTVGSNIETLELNHQLYTAWDHSGQDKVRPLWRLYTQNTRALIFVVDATDTARLDQAAKELKQIAAEEELENVPVLMYANKQDIKGAMSGPAIEKRLAMDQLHQKRWHVQPSSATTGRGVIDGMEWLASALKSKR